jgi:hypothetical protein
MHWVAVVLFVVVGAALIVWRVPAAHWQGMVAGGRLPAGCAVAEGIGFLLLAVLFFFLRS